MCRVCRTPSSNPPRSAFTISVIGLYLAKACSHPGIRSTGTKAALANVSGNSQMNPPDCAASTDFTDSPMKMPIQLKAEPGQHADHDHHDQHEGRPHQVRDSSADEHRHRRDRHGSEPVDDAIRH